MATATAAPSYLSPDSVAAILDVDRRFVYRLIAEGKLPATRLSHRNIRIRRVDLDAFIESRAIPSGGTPA